ncbi:hypothetical protein MRX96_018924 [Rhipicephalus microplus]
MTPNAAPASRPCARKYGSRRVVGATRNLSHSLFRCYGRPPEQPRLPEPPKPPPVDPQPSACGTFTWGTEDVGVRPIHRMQNAPSSSNIQARRNRTCVIFLDVPLPPGVRKTANADGVNALAARLGQLDYYRAGSISQSARRTAVLEAFLSFDDVSSSSSLTVEGNNAGSRGEYESPEGPSGRKEEDGEGDTVCASESARLRDAVSAACRLNLAKHSWNFITIIFFSVLWAASSQLLALSCPSTSLSGFWPSFCC